MRRQLERALGDIRKVVSDLDPRTITSADAADLIQIAVKIEQAGAGLKLLLAPRIQDASSWRLEGHRTPASWLAQKSGTSLGQAMGVIETAEKLTDLDRTSDAIRRGEISAAEAAQVATGASKNPRAEEELLGAAREHMMKKLQERSRRIRATTCSKEDEQKREAAIHRHRYLRHWTDDDGAFRLDARLTADAGARLIAGVEAEADSIFNEARKCAEHEAPHAYRADALVALASGCARGRNARRTASSRSVVNVHVDATALRRGHAKNGERCYIAGIGPVSVTTARRILGDAFVKILVENAVDVKSVCHVGRYVPAHVQSALDARDPVCVVSGCQVSHGLENHHWELTFEKCHTTSLDGLARICAYHHDLVTHRGYELTGGPGKWQLVPPRTTRCPDAEGKEHGSGAPGKSLFRPEESVLFDDS